jgi:hypothetical protein
VTVRSLLLFRIEPLTVVETDIRNENFCESVLWIRIGSDPHYFAGPDLERDRYTEHAVPDRYLCLASGIGKS